MSAALMALVPFLRGYGYTLVGSTPFDASSSVAFPQAAAAGDLAVLCATASNVGSAPSGFTAVAAGASLNYYKVCAGGETSTPTPYSSSTGILLLFRPTTGTTALQSGATDSPAASRTFSAASGQGVAVAIGSINDSAAWSATLPGTWNVERNTTSIPAIYVAWRQVAAGEVLSGMFVDNTSGGERQTIGLWTTT